MPARRSLSTTISIFALMSTSSQRAFASPSNLDIVTLPLISELEENGSYDLHRVIQVSRHGNRASSTIFDHLLPADKQHLNFKEDEDRYLQPSGVLQVANMAEHFIKPRYNDKMRFDAYRDPFGEDLPKVIERMSVRSTDTERTVQTAFT